MAEPHQEAYQDGGDDQGAVGQRVGHVGRLPPLGVRHVEAARRVPGSDLCDTNTPLRLWAPLQAQQQQKVVRLP